MTTPNNAAAALERLEQKWRESAKTERDYYSDALVSCANELATLRATLAQPDAISQQLAAGEGEPVAWLHDDGKDIHIITDKIKRLWLAAKEIHVEHYNIPLYTAPVAAPGGVDDEAAVDVALAAYNRAEYEWNKRPQDSRDEPRHRFAMRATVAALQERAP